MAKLKPIRLVIDKPLTGPYDRLLRRPGPEVENVGSGAYTVIIRGTRLTEALPLWEAEAACYYGKSNLRRGWSPDDFKQEQEAVNWQPPQQAKILAVPFGYFKLPNADWVSGLAAELTPWKAGVVAAWQKSIEKDIWLTILRLYHFSPGVCQIICVTDYVVGILPSNRMAN